MTIMKMTDDVSTGRGRFWFEVLPCMIWNCPMSLLAVARAGAGVNNIPLDKCAEKGIVVFNTPGANANGVKELVIAAMLLAARDIVGGIEWAKENKDDEGIAKSSRKGKKSICRNRD